MSGLISEAMRRREVFKNFHKHLEIIKKVALKVDPEAEVYLFGSVAERRHVYSSDIDVLVICRANPGLVLAELWRAGIKEPFEIHAETPSRLALYKGVALMKV